MQLLIANWFTSNPLRSLGDGLEHTPVDDATFRRCFFGPNPMLAKKSMSSSVSKGQEPEIYKNKVGGVFKTTCCTLQPLSHCVRCFRTAGS